MTKQKNDKYSSLAKDDSEYFSETDLDSSTLTDNDQIIFSDLKKLVDEISNASLRKKVINIYKLIIYNTEDKQREINKYNEDSKTLGLRIAELEAEVTAFKRTKENDSTNINKLIQEGEEQINELNQTIQIQLLEMQKLQNIIDILKSKNEDQEDQIKTLIEENQGLSLTVTTMKNAFNEIKRKSYTDKNFYSTTMLGNNSFDLSIMELNQSNSSNTAKNLQEEIDDTIKNDETNNVLESNKKTVLNMHEIQVDRNKNTKEQSKEDNITNDYNDYIRQQFIKLEEKINKNENKIKTMEEMMANKQVITPNFLDKQNINLEKASNKEKTTCYLVGDSHLRHINEELVKETGFTNNFNLKSNFVPGFRLEDTINKLIPEDIDKDDTLIISAGTNDLFTTSTEDIKENVDKLGKLKCSIIVISIPPQECEYRNRNIVRLNTMFSASRRHGANQIVYPP
ncbi:hypothetical protein M8J75_000701 [Diaphorina citri]|nr:hypothetical protein M8J75_000701 [Diaphorina citri]